MDKLYVCMEMGGTNLRFGLVNEAFEVLSFDKQPTQGLADAPDKFSYLHGILAPLIERAGGRERIHAVSLSLASLMDRERRVVYSSPMVRGFDNLALADGLESLLGVPVVMDKDVNLLLLYEIHRHGLPREGIVAGVFLGTGLGNAMCIDGKVYRGHSGAACELGHIPLSGVTRLCGCGKPGCIELSASGRLVHSLASEKGCAVEDLFVLHSKDEDVQSVLYHFAVAIATEVCLLDPAMVLLGGGVAEMPNFPMDQLQALVRANVRMPYPRETLCFASASGDPEAGIVGAAMHAAQCL